MEGYLATKGYPNERFLVDVAWLQANQGDSRLRIIDARTPQEYSAGHIPGAVNVPFAELAPEGRFLPPAGLRARFEAAGVHSGDEAVAYCGSGVTACVVVLAAEVAAIGAARLYPGSWSEWSGRGLPVERGERRH